MHGQTNKENWDIKILGTERDEFKRKLMESYYIRKYKPNLNVNEGISLFSPEYLHFKSKPKEEKE